MGKTYRRRTIYIYRDFQRSFIFSFCLATFGAMVATSVILIILFHWATEQDLAEIAPVLIGVNALVLGALVLLTFIAALLASHKVGGPLFRIEKALANISQGDLTEKITLRQDDKLKQLAANINMMTESLNSRVVHIKQQMEGVKRRLQDSQEGSLPGGLKEELEKLESAVDEMFTL